MSYTYSTYRLALQTMVASTDPDPDFDNILPSAIDYAEQRIYRELNLIQTVLSNSSTATSQGVRDGSISNTFVTVTNLNLLTPAGSTTSTGTRKPLLPVSRDLLDTMWPGSSPTGEPEMFAMTGQWSVIFGPTPDDAYNLEVVGTYRPTPLSGTNTTTFLTERLPDLFMAASMVFMSGYMRNFGTQANDPQMGASWEQQYGVLKGSAATEEERKHFWASAWSSLPPSMQSQTPGRG